MKDVRRRFALSKLPSEGSDYQAKSLNLWKVLAVILSFTIVFLLIFGDTLKENKHDTVNKNIYVEQLETSLTKMEDEFRLFKNEEVPKIQQRSYDLGVSTGEDKKNDALENQIKEQKKIIQEYKDEIGELNSRIDVLKSDVSRYKEQEKYLKSACKEVMKLRTSHRVPSYCKSVLASSK